MSNWLYAQATPTWPWRSAMTLPRRLQLAHTPRGWRVLSTPVRELMGLRDGSVGIQGRRVVGTVDVTGDLGFSPATSELRFVLRPDRDGEGGGAFGVVLSNRMGEELVLGYDPATREYFSDRTGSLPDTANPAFAAAFAGRVYRAPRISEADSVVLHLFVDVSSVELFADGGATVLTQRVFPSAPFQRVQLFSRDGAVRLVRGEGHRLAPAGRSSEWRDLEPRLQDRPGI